MADRKQPQLTGQWIAVDQVHPVRGMLHGARQPSMLTAIRLAAQPQELPSLTRGLTRLLEVCNAVTGDRADPQSGTWATCMAQLVRVIDSFLQPVGIAVADNTRVLHVAPDETCATRPSLLQLPVMPGSPRINVDALARIVRLVDLAMAGTARDALSDEVESVLAALTLGYAVTPTLLLLLRGATDLGIPFSTIAPNCFQFGQGSRSRWFETTFSDRTPSISVRLARDKAMSNVRMRQAGLPVPQQQFAPSEEQAVKAAELIGYPVVVKPGDEDQGRGVTADLQTEEELRDAWRKAFKISRNVIVEKHFQGRDYRMVVHNGELLWTVERVPAGVTGDGRSTVAKLVDTTNADPHRGTRRNSLLRPVHLDDEALLLLERQGLSVDAVPEAGRFVRLARIANVSRGGTPVQVNDEVHPDNRVLAIDAAQALRLDLAGIDLLIPDIATSWHESGAAICEVNAGPQIGGMTAAHLGRQFIGTTVEGDGRIPVIAVIGDTPDGGFAASLASALRARGLRAGHHDATGVWLGEKLVVGKRLGALAGGEVLLTNLECDAAIISYNDDDVMINGHASDRIDWLVVAGQHLGGESGDEAAFRARFGRLVSTVAQQCTGTFAVLSDSGFARPDRIVGGEGMTMSPDTPTRDEAIERIVADVM